MLNDPVFWIIFAILTMGFLALIMTLGWAGIVLILFALAITPGGIS